MSQQCLSSLSALKSSKITIYYATYHLSETLLDLTQQNINNDSALLRTFWAQYLKKYFFNNMGHIIYNAPFLRLWNHRIKIAPTRTDKMT